MDVLAILSIIMKTIIIQNACQTEDPIQFFSADGEGFRFTTPGKIDYRIHALGGRHEWRVIVAASGETWQLTSRKRRHREQSSSGAVVN